MSIIDTLITDRAAPGPYDWRDFNRVQEAVKYIADRFAEYGYLVTLEKLPSATRADLYKASTCQTYLDNVRKLRGVITLLPDTPDTPVSMNLWTYVKANNLEKILADIGTTLKTMDGVYLRAGMPWAVAGNGVYVKNA